MIIIPRIRTGGLGVIAAASRLDVRSETSATHPLGKVTRIGSDREGSEEPMGFWAIIHIPIQLFGLSFCPSVLYTIPK